MSISAKARYAVFAAVLAMPAMASAPASALTAASLRAASAATAVVNIQDRWEDDGDYSDRPYRRHHHDAVVDAPFTHVETGHRIIVDAPFAHVAIDRHGRHVVAPFVDLWLPR
jgi:hypothetical protein